jgi:CMP-N,N'-diacetyllegionaminic acid synthase
MNDGHIICIIPARGGSKGIPGKNLIDLNGKPLVAWSIVAALASGAVSRVIVSTDSEDIAKIARLWGAEVPFIRPPHLASDEVHAVHVVLHALDWIERTDVPTPAGVMMLLPTSPLRLAADIRGAAEMFRTRNAPAVVSIVDLGKYMTNLRYLDGENLVRVAPQEDPNAQRQGLRKLYGVNGSIFLAKPNMLREAGTFHLDGALGYVMSVMNSVDINTPEDMLLARQLLALMESGEAVNRLTE